jgi:hypothetical protein
MSHVTGSTIRVWHTLLLATFLLLTVSASVCVGVTLDPSTGLSATECQHVPLPSGDQPYNVLWDLTHGVFLEYEPSGRYSDLVALLGGEGFGTTTTDEGVDNINLEAYDVLVITVMSSWYSPYTVAEIEAIEQFIDGGGGVLVMGDNTDVPNANINPVAEAFGTTCGVAYVTPVDLYVSDFGVHPIFDGIGTVYMRAAGELVGDAPSEEVAWSDGGEPLVTAIADCGLIVAGDANFCSNDYLGEADNDDFILNVFECLGDASGPVEGATWGRIKALHR